MRVLRGVFAVAACAGCGRLSFDQTTRDALSSPTDALTSGDGAAPCIVATAPSRVSAYTFADSGSLGRDAVGGNDLTFIVGNPQAVNDAPPGFPGKALMVNGTSGLCLASGFTFDTTADHTACWWSKQTVLADNANQFAHTCGYDTWTTNTGADYQWRINNCNGGVVQDLDVPNVFAAGVWVHICQTYERATLTRTVYINGDITNPHVSVDTAPILMLAGYYWCVGSYYFDGSGGGGYFTGAIYAPIWFNRVLPRQDIADMHVQTCTP